MDTSKTEKYFLFTLLIVVLVLTLLILYPFLTVFIFAAAFTVVISPVYSWIKSKTFIKKSGWASFVTILLFLAILCIPIFFMGTVIFKQTQDAYNSISELGSTSSLIQKIDYSINNIIPEGMSFNTYEKVENITSFLANNIGNFFKYTINTLFLFMLTVFTMFYMLKDGRKWKDGLIKLTPLSKIHVEEILSSLKNSINRIIKGSFFIAIVQGILSWLGLWIFGVPNPALWGVVAGLGSFIPTIGTSIISVPAVIFLLFSGMQLEALGLLLWSIVIVGLVDNLLSPYIISKNTEIPAIFILFSILGGISFMGTIGILIGPLTLSLLYSLVSIYKNDIS